MSIKLKGSSDGSVSFDAPADTSPSGSDITLTLPTSAGSANQFLKNSGIAGELEYSSMVEDSSGRLLVGATSATLDSSQAPLQVSHSSGPLFVLGRDDTTVSSGNLIGDIKWYSNAGSANEEVARIRVDADAEQGSGDKPGRIEFHTTANGASSPTERMRIASDGQISLYSAGSSARTSVLNAGTSSGSSAFDVKNNATSTTIGTQVFSIRENGDIYTSGSTTVQSLSSERRLKENIEVIDPATAWTTIKNTPYYSYNYIGQEGPRYGPIVDEVPADMVRDTDLSDDQGPIRTFDNGMLHARLYSALQQAIAKIETLEAKVAALEAQ